MQKVARNTRNCQKVAEQLVESPIRLDFFLEGRRWLANPTTPEQGLEPTIGKLIPRLLVINGSRVCVTIHKFITRWL